MAEEKKYTETEYRKKVLEIADMYFQIESRYEHRNSSLQKSHELRTFIANAKQTVPQELRTLDFQKCLKGLEEKLLTLTHS